MDLNAVYGLCGMLSYTLMCCLCARTYVGKSLPVRGIVDAFTTMYTCYLAMILGKTSFSSC